MERVTGTYAEEYERRSHGLPIVLFYVSESGS